MVDPDERLPPPPHEPEEDEAEAQAEATVMPWVWGAVGVLVIAAFIAWAVFVKPQAPPPAVPQYPPLQGAPAKS
jgi:hypothetical protein